MNYNKAAFEAAAGLSKQLIASDIPEIVFSGRSNAGKSSLINKIVNRKSLARTSSQPGKTATINFYRIDDCRFVDLPGYGYAKVSASEKKRWGQLVEGYFAQKRNIALVIQIVDIRHELSAYDCDMVDFLTGKGIPFVLAATKADKLNQTQRKEQCAYFDQVFSNNGYLWLPVSAASGEGVELLRDVIEKHCR